ncbi:hypothetical protein Cfor_05674 [Coptotermes formosanus]|uniref:Uncharacterized protein n=1 Tax=Coptotermes formosanus TaxID=36987 RepID=A0A6L2PBR0_COPFO|nr:hypothetical protein Cfor_05674 [Coptotermes formosanus]
MRRTSFALLRERIRDIRQELDKVSPELLETHLLLSASLRQHDWDMEDLSTSAQACLALTSATSTQKLKFDCLYSKTHPKESTGKKWVVINLTDRMLDDAAVSILGKGLNFAQTTHPAYNIKDSISRIEQAIQHLPKDMAEEIRQEACHILKHTIPKKKRSEKLNGTLKSLRDDKDIMILPVDKGNATTVMSNEDYNNKMTSIVREPVYKRLTSDLTRNVKMKVGVCWEFGLIQSKQFGNTELQTTDENRGLLTTVRAYMMVLHVLYVCLLILFL